MGLDKRSTCGYGGRSLLKITDVKLNIENTNDDIYKKVSEILKTDTKNIESVEILKKSLDARHKDNIFYNLTVSVKVKSEEKYLNNKNVSKYIKKTYAYPCVSKLKSRPVVVGAGPAGLFASLILAIAGARPIIIEKGESVDERKKSVENFFKNNILNEKSNVQFGEGGAGAFSDGKLNTGTKDVRHKKILEEFVLCGAPEEILYVSKPHIGTDRLIPTIKNLRKRIISLGGEFRFNTEMTDISVKNNKVCAVITDNGEIETDYIVYCAGHSARESLRMLYKKGVNMIKKPFSVGFRIEQKQSIIDESQYGMSRGNLPSADYKMSVKCKNQRTAYTFCMCPGGSVVAASSEHGGVVTNGMSNFLRNGINANSAVLANVFPSDLPNDLFSGIEFQREIERKAYMLSGSDFSAPVLSAEEYVYQKPHGFNVTPTYPCGVKECDISTIFPDYVNQTLKDGLKVMNITVKNFISGAVLTAPETRSSCPLQIVRNENMESTLKGFYPCGEGAGMAGGIMSAASDGMKVAEALLRVE